MKKITISSKLKEICPELRIAVLSANVINTQYDALLWQEINTFTDSFSEKFSTEEIKKNSIIKATRDAYKLCGKDPSRYRPSSESLLRRILKGQALYQINTLVDLVNYASLVNKHSIGGFDENLIQGMNLTIGIGEKNEDYTGIGRGKLNIEFLPVLRDEVGGIGTPTSDNERTAMTMQTTKILCVINGYGGNVDLLKNDATHIKELLVNYANAKDITIEYID